MGNGKGDSRDLDEDFWKELTKPRSLEGSMSDALPAKDDTADAREGQAMLGKLVLGRFRVDKFLDGGSVGRIFRGTQLGLGRPVAIKVLRRTDGPRGELAKKRFVREAEFLAAMNHPNVVELIAFGETEDGNVVMVMELLEGHTLRDHIKRGPIAVERVLHIAIQLAEAAARAHDLGGVHRDLKPANIFLERDEHDNDLVKVLDFGLVKPSGNKGASASITMSGYVLGTPFYMSPEQAMNERIDGRADIYSLGVMIYEMLTGVPPFRGDTVAEILAKHLEASPPPLAAGNPRVVAPARLELLVRRCLAKNRADRPESMYAVIHELEAVQLTQRQLAHDLDESLAGWDPEQGSQDIVDPAEVGSRSDPRDPLASDDPWRGPSNVSGGPWSEGSQPPLVAPVADDRVSPPPPRLPPFAASAEPLALLTPGESYNVLESDPTLGKLKEGEASYDALVPVDAGGRLLPPPVSSISNAGLEADEVELEGGTQRRLSRALLLALGVLMIALAVVLVQWAQTSFSGQGAEEEQSAPLRPPGSAP
ncbi:MAG: serine/threonine protein kinase [Myxococcales bacterium]|nr:serine/threonine protein kinase [Myxococcales bacterium]